jgi:hypothetical protein
MNALALAHPDNSIGDKPRTIRQRWSATFQIVGVAAGLVGGAGAGIFGSLLTAVSWMSTNEFARYWFSIAGSTLLLLTIPLVILGAFCLDWLEKNQIQRRSDAKFDDDDEQ